MLCHYDIIKYKIIIIIYNYHINYYAHCHVSSRRPTARHLLRFLSNINYELFIISSNSKMNIVTVLITVNNECALSLLILDLDLSIVACRIKNKLWMII